jgi:hypothetical protein
VPRVDRTYEDVSAATWLRGVLVPVLVFVIAVAIVCALVASGAVQGHKTYPKAPRSTTTQQTVLIQPSEK